MTNRAVVENWSKGKKGKSRHLSTDGMNLFSYTTKIGFTGEDGYKYVYNYTAHKARNWLGCQVDGRYISATTSHHVSMAGRVGSACTPPEE